MSRCGMGHVFSAQAGLRAGVAEVPGLRESVFSALPVMCVILFTPVLVYIPLKSRGN